MDAMHDLDGYINGTHPLTFAANSNLMDTPNYWQVMNWTNANLFMEAMEVKMNAMKGLCAWKIINLDAVPYSPEGVRCTVTE
eukprot:9414897-Ditylum_brightwellii.AAC.1